MKGKGKTYPSDAGSDARSSVGKHAGNTLRSGSREPQMQRAARSQEAAFKQPERRTESVALAKQTEGRNGRREAATEPPGDTGKAFGPEPPPDGTGRRKRNRTMNAGSYEPAGMCETVCKARLRPGGAGPMRRASRCWNTHGAMAREVVENASPRLNCPGQPRNGDRPNSAGRPKGVAWGWWRHRPHLLWRAIGRTGSPARRGWTSGTGRPGAARPDDSRHRSAWRHP